MCSKRVAEKKPERGQISSDAFTFKDGTLMRQKKSYFVAAADLAAVKFFKFFCSWPRNRTEANRVMEETTKGSLSGLFTAGLGRGDWCENSQPRALRFCLRASSAE